MTITNKDRVAAMRELAEVVKHVKKKNFDITSWAESNPRRRGHICDTSACVLGWAAITPSIAKKLGIGLFAGRGDLRIRISNDDQLSRVGFLGSDFEIVKCDNNKVVLSDSEVGEEGSLEAGINAFNIGDVVGSYLFLPGRYERIDDGEEAARRLSVLADYMEKNFDPTSCITFDPSRDEVREILNVNR